MIYSNSFFLPVMFNETVLLVLDHCDCKSSKQTWRKARLCKSCQLLEPLLLCLSPSDKTSENRMFSGNRTVSEIHVELYSTCFFKQVQILHTRCSKVYSWKLYIFTRIIISQKVIVTVSVTRLWLSQDIKSNVKICKVHHIHSLFCVKMSLFS